jgi:3-oxoacyl-[acyl-carrier-protein] synthase II
MSAPVWVTGLGAVTAAGIGTGALRERLLASRSTVAPDPALGHLGTARGPALPPARATRHLDRSAALFVIAAEEAWVDAGLSGAALDPSRCGVLEGSSLGPMAEALATFRALGDPPQFRPTGLVRFMTGAGGATIAQHHGLLGPVLHLSAGSVSAACAIGEAFARIASGAADVVVAGGSECPLVPEIVGHFQAAGILAPPANGAPACRPFDALRRGTVLGEGAGVLILESAAHATHRGARPYAAVSGYGLSCEAHSMIRPDPAGSGVATAAATAIGATPLEEIDWIKAHGTGTRANDAAECAGLATVFGQQLAEKPITALKPTVGHCLGASGAVEAVAAILCSAAGIVPATVGTSALDPALPPCRLVREVEARSTRHALLLSESFGGRCAALLIAAA